MMRITISDEKGEGCRAVIDERERRMMSLPVDDERAQRTLVGLSVLAGCVAAILEDVRRGGMTMEGAGRKYELGERESARQPGRGDLA